MWIESFESNQFTYNFHKWYSKMLIRYFVFTLDAKQLWLIW